MMHTGEHCGGLLAAARAALDLTAAQAASRAGLRGRSGWHNRETACTPRVASRLLTALYGAPWVAVEGPDWAVAMPAGDMHRALTEAQGA